MKGVLLVRRRHRWPERRGARALPLSKEEVVRRYRGVDGEPWLEALDIDPEPGDGLADIARWDELQQAAESLTGRDIIDAIVVTRGEPVPGLELLGYDVGWVAVSGTFSSIFHEALHGACAELRAHAAGLNSALLLAGRAEVDAYLTTRRALLASGADLERARDVEALAIWGRAAAPVRPVQRARRGRPKLASLPAPAKDTRLSDAIWTRLVRGASLADLDLPRKGTRTVVGALDVPASGGHVPMLKGVALRQLDFGGADLSEVRFDDVQIEDCDFHSATCEMWRMWSVDVRRTSFYGASLRESMLGATANGLRRNTWTDVDFTAADLSHSMYKAAAFERCDFSDARIAHVDFAGSTFKHCRFAGILDEVIFWGRSLEDPALPVNTMNGVDLSAAILRNTELRNLDPTLAVLPTDPEHIIVRDYERTLDCVLAQLANDSSAEARGLRAWLGANKKWCLPGTSLGIWNRRDFRKAGIDELFDRLLAACQPADETGN